MIESDFVPVAVFNNQPGRDEELLRKFREPAWNYQVVRFFDARGRELLPRKDKVWTLDGIASRMIKALRAAGRDVPKELSGLAAPPSP